MPTPAITTGIIHIEMLDTPAKSNADVSIGIDIPPIAGNDFSAGTQSFSKALAKFTVS